MKLYAKPLLSISITTWSNGAVVDVPPLLYRFGISVAAGLMEDRISRWICGQIGWGTIGEGITNWVQRHQKPVFCGGEVRDIIKTEGITDCLHILNISGIGDSRYTNNGVV